MQKETGNMQNMTQNSQSFLQNDPKNMQNELKTPEEIVCKTTKIKWNSNLMRRFRQKHAQEKQTAQK